VDDKKDLDKILQDKRDKLKQEADSIVEEIESKKKFLNIINEISNYLSWGRAANIYILGCEGDGTDGMLEPHDLFYKKVDEGLSIIEETEKNKKIKFVLPLYEEFFGSLTEKDLQYPGNEEYDYEMYLEGYKRLIDETIDTLQFHGTVKQDKNIFILNTSDTDLILKNNAFSLESELTKNLHDVLCF
tara:strand:+ start:5121 stop:5681 length:561 start_codon:yes stop_codon:yes gene_type:complete